MIDAGLEKQIREYVLSYVNERLKIKIKDGLAPIFVERCIDLYDRLFVANEGNIGKSDPTSPTRLRPKFIDYLVTNVNRLFYYNGEAIILSDIYYKDFGLGTTGPHRKETDPYKILYFYFTGLIGKYVFISVDTLAKIKGKPIDKHLGRYGEGFFLKAETYAKLASKISGLPSVSEVISPLSGKKGTDIIYQAFVEMSPTIQQYVSKYLLEIQKEKKN